MLPFGLPEGYLLVVDPLSTPVADLHVLSPEHTGSSGIDFASVVQLLFDDCSSTTE